MGDRLSVLRIVPLGQLRRLRDSVSRKLCRAVRRGILTKDFFSPRIIFARSRNFLFII